MTGVFKLVNGERVEMTSAEVQEMQSLSESLSWAPPEPEKSTRRVDIYTRATVDEAARFSEALDTAEVRSREIINATMRYVHGSEPYRLLAEIAADVWTPERRAIILAPSET